MQLHTLPLVLQARPDSRVGMARATYTQSPSRIRVGHPHETINRYLCSNSRMVKARKWVLRSHFVGQPKREDLEIVEEELPPIKDGGQHKGAVLPFRLMQA